MKDSKMEHANGTTGKTSEMQHEHMQHDDMADMPMDNEQMGHQAGMETMAMDQGTMAHGQMNHGDMHMSHGDMSHMDMHHGDMSHMDMDHGGGHMMHMGNLKQKFWVSLIVMIPVLLLSQFMGMNIHLGALQLPIVFPGSDWLVLILSSFLFFYGGWPFLTGAKSELQQRQPAMMTLIAMGITVAYGYSLYAFVMNHFIAPNGMVMDFFWELATLIVIMLLGHWIEMNAVMAAGNAVEKLAALLPSQAHVVHGDHVMDMPLAEVQVGTRLRVLAGEQMPADGQIVSGSSSVNESLVTGEAKAIHKAEGDRVIGGSVNGDGVIEIKVTGTGESGYLSQVMKLVQSAQANKSKAEGMADKVAGWLFYAALAVGILAFFIWLTDGAAIAFERMVTVFIIACPHALGLAIPLVIARSTSIGATNGLLIRNRQALETAKHAKFILMDKTGTLTEGKFTVAKTVAFANHDEAQVLALMAALESHSEHPLATGIKAAAKEQQLNVPAAQNVQVLKGIGLQGEVDGQAYTIVNARYLKDHQLSYDQAQADHLAAAGNSLAFLLQKDQVLGMVAEGDQLKPSSKPFVAALKRQGITPVMLTGDNHETAKKVADQLGLTDFQAELKPEDKVAQVKAYQQRGVVMMVGDGVNDAPSLAQADIGVAIGAGTDVAIDTADVVLVHSDPADILNFLSLAKATNRKMVQNLWWGAGYNILAIPLAAGILAPIGFILSPAVGAAIMSLSTIVVALNAMTLHLNRA
ncbi:MULTISPECIES: heavy metal translocating P-type ATPase [Lacticaseibacillus]|uniref:P-type Cu(+) transporter n=2 Tax=Lacticaseibacillus TaxID=2759736 RepID=A0AAN1KE23_LACCA|nr:MULTISPECIES: heavy metal translocating P-type ATPase [Lacticaseibacillus]ARY91792.1 copper-translocating P-type ATPase [Lacticaseibacillus casei]KAB1968945.1 copper-translocating P-type ATPase [Lacticaseibacillus casei]WLV79692.1 copper-translocating P-type ATPase [Lacticaseibacillus sp. NCIMB 15473]WNX23652.1 copper-translocating P-type ATPase [Lacticaseibacillus casei]WNX26427.1 copper-translocating P-type ATPase [Lacticaseibacillus casei]